MASKKKKKNSSGSEADYILGEESILGEPWVPVYKMGVEFTIDHFRQAMANLIRQPNINSTVIMRADILKENNNIGLEDQLEYVSSDINKFPEFPSSLSEEDEILHRDLTDLQLRTICLQNSKIELNPRSEIIRRIIPRNPYKDHIINQTCLIYGSDKDENQDNAAALVVYIPHIKAAEETPFYLPPVYGVGILYYKSELSIQYIPFPNSEPLQSLKPTDRSIRIALRLIQTSAKHSHGAKTGYEKRVYHDLVVPKIEFQNRYISLKKKYSSKLVNLWVESTDPKKHVFEDLAIAAFLIEYWNQVYPNKSDFEFRDLGCGNGLLVYILNLEGYKGQGIDARARKSWLTYPKEIQQTLKEQIIIPLMLLKPHPALSKMAPHVTDNGRLFNVPQLNDNNDTTRTYYSSSNLLSSDRICTTDNFPKNTFIIGNHSDELTCWIPLLGYPFIVIPCCSHALSGLKYRFRPRKSICQTQTSSTSNQTTNTSTYGALVDHVEDLANQMGWQVQKEMLRIPSTRNAAIIGCQMKPSYQNLLNDAKKVRPWDILTMEGGAEGWVENSVLLMKKAPRSH